MLGIGVEQDVLAVIVLGHGVKQAHHAGVDQVVQIHMHRQAFMNPDGNRLHQRKVLEHNLIANLV